MRYYCISLRETPERTARVQAEFEREGVPVTWVWGVYGKSMRIKSEIPMHSDYYVTRNVMENNILLVKSEEWSYKK